MKKFLTFDEFIKKNYLHINESDGLTSNDIKSDNEKLIKAYADLEVLAKQIENINKEIKKYTKKLNSIKTSITNKNREAYIIKLMHKLEIKSFDLDGYTIQIKERKKTREMYQQSLKNFMSYLTENNMEDLLDNCKKIIESYEKTTTTKDIKITPKKTNEDLIQNSNINSNNAKENEQLAKSFNDLINSINSFNYGVDVLGCFVNIKFDYVIDNEVVAIKDLVD